MPSELRLKRTNSLHSRIKASRARWKKIKCSLAFGSVKSQLDREYAEQLREAEKLIREVDTNGDGIPDDLRRATSGFDASMYTKDSLRARKLLGKDREIKKLIYAMWDGVMETSPSLDGLMRKELYVNVNLLLSKAMVPSAEWDPKSAAEGAEEDWQEDNNDGVLDKQAFFRSIFELVDIWCLSIDPDEYLSVCHKITDTLLGPEPRRRPVVLQTMDQVVSMADKPKAAVPRPKQSDPELPPRGTPAEKPKRQKKKSVVLNRSVGELKQPARYLQVTTKPQTNQPARYLQGNDRQQAVLLRSPSSLATDPQGGAFGARGGHSLEHLDGGLSGLHEGKNEGQPGWAWQAATAIPQSPQHRGQPGSPKLGGLQGSMRERVSRTSTHSTGGSSPSGNERVKRTSTHSTGANQTSEPRAADLVADLAETQFAKMDLDNDGKATREDWIEYYGSDEHFDNYDWDGSGFISLAEFRAAKLAEAEFAKMDIDGDGIVTRDEWLKHYGTDKYFDQYDTDRNGLASLDEFRMASSTHSEQDGTRQQQDGTGQQPVVTTLPFHSATGTQNLGEPGWAWQVATATPRRYDEWRQHGGQQEADEGKESSHLAGIQVADLAETQFAKMDLDKDGKATREDWIEYYGSDEHFDNYDWDGSGFISLAEFRAAKLAEAEFAKMDIDGDGIVTRDEWLKHYGNDTHFDNYDWNKDGWISIDEFRMASSTQSGPDGTGQQPPAGTLPPSCLGGSRDSAGSVSPWQGTQQELAAAGVSAEEGHRMKPVQFAGAMGAGGGAMGAGGGGGAMGAGLVHGAMGAGLVHGGNLDFNVGNSGKRKVRGRRLKLHELAAEQRLEMNTKYLMQADLEESLRGEVYDKQLLSLAKILHRGDNVELLSQALSSIGGYPIAHKGQSRLRGHDILMLAAKSGRLQCTQELLRRWGAPVNSVNDRGSSPLILAAMKGRAELVSCLLEWSADPEMRGMDKDFKACDNALGWAQRNGFVKVLRTIGMHMLRRDAKPSTSKVMLNKPITPTCESSVFMTSMTL